jgi:hypothetical protein
MKLLISAALTALTLAVSPASACTEGARSCQEGAVMKCTCLSDFKGGYRCSWMHTGETCGKRSELPQSRKPRPDMIVPASQVIL